MTHGLAGLRQVEQAIMGVHWAGGEGFGCSRKPTFHTTTMQPFNRTDVGEMHPSRQKYLNSLEAVQPVEAAA